MASLELVELTKRFGSIIALDGLNLRVPDGEILVLLGPRGSCKTTILRMIAGLSAPTFGDILIDGVRINDIPTHQRNMAMVFEQYALYPHLSVGANIAYPLMIRGVPSVQCTKLVRQVATTFELLNCLNRLPAELTRGMRKRAALARTLVRHPSLFLMDEPMSDLDPRRRAVMYGRFKRLQRKLGVTTIYVTHDQVEAMSLADRICILNSARIQQIAKPTDIYARPANIFVASFIGSPPMNLIEGQIDGMEFVRGNHRISLPMLPAAFASTPVLLGQRPEDIDICEPEKADLVGTVDDCVSLCGRFLVNIDIGGDYVLVLADSKQDISVGKPITVCLRPDRTHLFVADGSARLDID